MICPGCGHPFDGLLYCDECCRVINATLRAEREQARQTTNVNVVRLREPIRDLSREELITARDYLRSGLLCVGAAADSIEAVDDAHTTLVQLGQAVEDLENVMQQLEYCIQEAEPNHAG